MDYDLLACAEPNDDLARFYLDESGWLENLMPGSAVKLTVVKKTTSNQTKPGQLKPGRPPKTSPTRMKSNG